VETVVTFSNRIFSNNNNC